MASPKPSETDAQKDKEADKKADRKASGKKSAQNSVSKSDLKSASKSDLKSGLKSGKNGSDKPAMELASSSDASAFFSRVQIVAQYLKDLSFESPNAPQIFSQAQGTTPHFSLDINVKPQRLAPQRHEVTLVLKVAMQRGSEVCFLVEIVYAGLVAVPEDAENNPLLQALLLIEVPRLLFPYARNILSELTQSSGFPPLVVQPIDFAALYRKHLAEAQAQAKAQAQAQAKATRQEP